MVSAVAECREACGCAPATRGAGQECGRRRQQWGADASGPPPSYEPGSPRSQALGLELSRLSRGQAQRAESLRSARGALAQIKVVATPPDGPRRVRAKIVNSISWSLR